MRDTATVVVCTRGRAGVLPRCLASIAGQPGRFDLLVVDNAPVPEVDAEIVAAVGARLLHEPGRGLDRARNRALTESVHDVVVFIDDDCVAADGWLPELVAPFVDPAVVAVTGRTVAADLGAESARWFEEWFGFDRGPDARIFHAATTPGAVVAAGSVGTGCNMAVRRSTALGLGGFDHALDVGTMIGGGGDLDMFSRLLLAGGTIRYQPRAVVRHHHRDRLPDLRRQFFGYGLSFGAVHAKLAVERPELRRRAVRHGVRRLSRHGRAVAARIFGRTRFPASLVVIDALGIVLGPLAYPVSAWRERRHDERCGGATPFPSPAADAQSP